jgi:transketolase
MRKTSLDMVYELARKDERIVFIGSDLGVGTLNKFKTEMPDRFLMEGVSEAHIVGMAAGLALEGKIVYVNTIATFLTRRCFEQVVLDLCLHKTNVRLIANGGGLVYAPLGPTHEATDDLAIFRCLPNMTILAVADAEEMKRMMPLTVNHAGPIYIRLGKGGEPVVTDANVPFKIGKAFPMGEGHDALIISTGVMLKACLDAAADLATKGIKATVLHSPTVKPFDTETFFALAQKTPVIVTVEEHTIIGGLGSAAAELIAEADFTTPKKFRRLGLPDFFPDQYGNQASLLKRFDLTTEKIVAAVQQLSAKR